MINALLVKDIHQLIKLFIHKNSVKNQIQIFQNLLHKK
jgi:hypothetical protein